MIFTFAAALRRGPRAPPRVTASTLRATAVARRSSSAQSAVLAPACTDEGALSFVTNMCHSYRDSPYKRELGRCNDRRPSSKPAFAARSARAASPAPSSFRRSPSTVSPGSGARSDWGHTRRHAHCGRLRQDEPDATDGQAKLVCSGAAPHRCRSFPRTCPGRKPAFLVFKRPARSYKYPIQNGFSWENAKER